MPLPLQYTVVILLGLILGSFATAVLYRVPRGIPWGLIKDKKLNRSACTHCNAPLKPLDLVPVFSWLALRGKCRYCKKDIGTVYLQAELLTLVACIGIYAAWGLSASSVIAMFAMPFLVGLLFIDLERYILPDQLVLIVGVLALARLAVEYDFYQSIGLHTLFMEYLLAGIVYGALAWIAGVLMSSLRKKDMLGFGDVKFFAVAGLWLGMGDLPWFCVLSGVLGVILGITWKAMKKGDIFPFGPALIFSLYLLLII